MGRFSKLETGPGREDRDGERAVAAHSEPSSEAQLDDVDAPGCLRRGRIALIRGERKLALRLFSRAIDKDASFIEAWQAMIRLLMLQGNISEARSWIGRGLTIFPDSPPIVALRSVNYARRGMIRQALTNSDAVLEKIGGDPWAHIARGEVLMLAGNKNAAYCFDQALKLTRSDDWYAPAVIGLILQEHRLWAKSLAFFIKAVERNSREAGLFYQIGRCHAQLGHRTQSAKAFEEAIELLDPNDLFVKRIQGEATGSVIGRLFRWLGRILFFWK